MADIELVIKIPEEEYDLIVNDEACGLNVLTRAIANGTPLPKEHGPLKDADKIIESMVTYMRDKNKTHTAEFVMSVAKSMVDLEQPIINAPTIIEADEVESEESNGRE